MTRRGLSRFAFSASALLITAGTAAAQGIPLEGIVVTSTKTSEAAIDALSGSSVLTKQQLDEQFQAGKASQFLMTLPGVTTSETARDPGVAINIRGLQDFGRVNVLLEGARQNFQRSGHNANGVFYIEPEMLKSVDITRGPTSVIYGSGAIGGVAAFSLLDADDILRGNEMAALRSRVQYTSNGSGTLVSETGAMKVGNFDILGQMNWRNIGNYHDGAGKDILDSGRETNSSLVKGRWRLAPGHQITGTFVDYNSDFVDRPSATSSTRRASDVHNEQYTIGYTFARPDTPLLDFSAKVYQNNTTLNQRVLSSALPGIFKEPVGALRGFDLETQGFDINNTSRFSFGNNMKWALTYGGDAFRDEVVTFDKAPTGNGDDLTPSGRRTVAGAFVQSQLTMFSTIDIITALRYDSYELEGGKVTSDGTRVSPKVTVGYTLLKGVTVFGTYAEGYRAPAITETLIQGTHPQPSPFVLLPNPKLTPETAHNWEGGVNLKFDNILKQNDAFRGRIVVFSNKVDDYIEGVLLPNPPPFGTFQYQNIASAKLEGIEIEGLYDARTWFFGLAAHRIRGTNEETGFGLLSVPADRIVLTAGFRPDPRVIVGTRVHFVDEQDRLPPPPPGPPPVVVPSDGYTTVDLFAQMEVNPWTTINFNVDNLLDRNYRQFLDQSNSPGLSARLGLTMRFGVTPAGVTP